MPHSSSRPFQFASFAPVLLAVIALTLAGCGRRGALEAPPGAPGQTASGQKPGNRLSPVAAGTSRQSAADRDPLAPTSRSSDGEDDEPPIPAPNRPFILDAIL